MKALLYVLILFFLLSCGKRIVAPELLGHWKSGLNLVTVRSEPKLLKYQFNSDSAVVTLKIYNNNTVSGSIGLAEFVNGRIKKNISNPDSAGIGYIIECGYIGKIFESDPLISKQVEIWLGPVKDSINAELLYSENVLKFSMSEMKFTKDTVKEIPVENYE